MADQKEFHLVRSHLEYCNSVWAPYKTAYIDKLKKVQKRATKMIPGLRKMHDPDRLKQLNLPTLTYRRSRGDMIETQKLLTGKYDQQVALAVPKNVTGKYFTRDNTNKLLVKRCRYELQKNFFSNRIVNMWNSLPDYVVMSDTINTFKNRLDAHWKHRDFFISLSTRATYSGTEDYNLCLSIRKLMRVCGLRGDAYVHISQW